MIIVLVSLALVVGIVFGNIYIAHFRARRPMNKAAYHAMLETYNFHARDVMLWVIHCLLRPPDGMQDEEYILKLVESFSSRDSNPTVLKDFKKKNCDLGQCDVTFLKNLILELLKDCSADLNKKIKIEKGVDDLATKNDILISAKKDIQKCLYKLTNIRNDNCHTGLIAIDISTKKDFDKIKRDFLNTAKILIFTSQKMPLSTVSLNKAQNFWKKLNDDLRDVWQHVHPITNDPQDDEAEIFNTMLDAEMTKQEKDPEKLDVKIDINGGSIVSVSLPEVHASARLLMEEVN